MQSHTGTHGSLSISLESIWQHKRYFVICLAISLSVGVLYLLTATPTHQVSARLLVEERTQPLAAGRFVPENNDFLPTQAEIIRSPAVIQRVVEMLSLPPAPPGESRVVAILEDLKVAPLAGTDILSLNFQGPDSDQAIRTMHAIIASYETYVRSSEQDGYQEAITLLTEREQELRKELGRLHTEYAELRRDSQLMGVGQDTAAMQQTLLENLAERLTTAKSRRIQYENHLQSLEALRDSGLASSSSSPVVPTGLSSSPGTPAVEAPRSEAGRGTPLTSSLATDFEWQSAIDLLSRMSREGPASFEDPAPIQQALLEAQTREAELSQRFGAKHPDVRGVRHLIESLQTRLRRTAHEAPQLLERELVTLRREEQSLTELYDRQFERAKTVDLALLKEQKTLDEIERVKLTHDSITTQLDELRLENQALSGGRASVTTRVLDGPELVNGLVWPQPAPLLGLCGLIGLCGGFVLVTVRQQLQQPAHAVSEGAGGR